MGVPQYTTPTFTLTFTDKALDLTACHSVYVTFKAKTNGFTLTKTGEDLTVAEKSIGVHLDQQETGGFSTGEILIQANWIDAYGNRAASEIATCSITDQLLKRVIAT